MFICKSNLYFSTFLLLYSNISILSIYLYIYLALCIAHVSVTNYKKAIFLVKKHQCNLNFVGSHVSSLSNGMIYFPHWSSFYTASEIYHYYLANSFLLAIWLLTSFFYVLITYLIRQSLSWRVSWAFFWEDFELLSFRQMPPYFPYNTTFCVK